MAIKIDATAAKTAYHIVDGAMTFPYSIDADSAIGRHPLEWGATPWSADDAANARKQMSDIYNRDVETAKAKGLPAPVKPSWLDVEPVQYTAEEQAAIDEHAKAVAEATERLNKRRAELAKQKEIDDQVAADEVLIASPPPMPDMTSRRPTKKEQRAAALTLTPEEQAEADRNHALLGFEPVQPQPVIAPAPLPTPPVA